MARKPSFEKREIERFQVSFHETMRQERAFLAAWFDQPWGRRQAWARGILHLGLKAQLAGRGGCKDVKDIPAEPSRQRAHPVTLTLNRGSPVESEYLAHLDPLPYSRRSEWLRKTLLQGMWLNGIMVPMLTAGHPAFGHATQALPPSTPQSTEEVPASIPATVSWSRLGKKARRVDGRVVENVQPLERSATPAIFTPAFASPASAETVSVPEGNKHHNSKQLIAQKVSAELNTMDRGVNVPPVDIDLSDASDPFTPEDASGEVVEPGGKLSDLAGLFA